MLWITILLLTLSASSAIYKENGSSNSLVCECTTSACRASGERRCRTSSGLCFAQRLGRLGRLVVRGCTAGRTPLLCENRPPAPLIPVHGGWPLLLCCARPLCNKRAVPSPPPWFKERVDAGNLTTVDLLGLNITTTDSPMESNLTSSTHPPPLYTVRRKSSYLPQLVSPITLSVVGFGVIGLAVIGTVAALLLRKKEGRDYGALEHDPRQCDCGAVTPT